MTHTRIAPAGETPLVSLAGASCAFGERTLWSDLDLAVRPGEFIAVLGPNGAGKTTLLRALLGELPLSSGSLHRPRSLRIGYIPQSRQEAPLAPLRGCDLVGLGVDGHRPGLRLRPSARRAAQQTIDAVLDEVGASAYGRAPITMLSGGELQRLRVAQALAADPQLLLCDEPLASLDLGHQGAISRVLGGRAAAGTGIVFVTHEITPVLPYVDRVVYIAHGRARIGTVDEVMRADVLSDLYGRPVEVIRRGDAIVVLTPQGRPGGDENHCDPQHSLPADRGGDPL